jgi:hypothetical protein
MLLHGNAQQILDHLSATERQLLAEAASGDGSMHAERFAAKYGVACPAGKKVTRLTDTTLELPHGTAETATKLWTH